MKIILVPPKILKPVLPPKQSKENFSTISLFLLLM